jgi:hypothetical protein
MPRPRIIEWPDKAKICVTFIIPWEVWPENFATRESLQRHGTHTIPPANAVFKQVESKERKVVVVPYNVPG